MPTPWTPERRAQQAEHARKVKPWLHATGPRTPEGKAICARNPYKGGHWRTFRDMHKLLNAELRDARRLIEQVRR
ncbi:hypothetical protein B1A_05002 [mine drainage metagenome]|uniref:Uncharacterized protein n=1 Tax=mine drainage metagenome TaxID=410659 RepID=T1B2Q7_9ZZZZ